MSDPAPEEREIIHLSSPFYSIWALRIACCLSTLDECRLSLLSPLIQMPISIRNTLTDTTRNNASPATWIFLNLVKVTPKINRHTLFLQMGSCLSSSLYSHHFSNHVPIIKHTKAQIFRKLGT